MSHTLDWAKVDLAEAPKLVTDAIPGPKSDEMHGRAGRIMKGYSSQVRLFPVAFEEGKGCTLTDVDGNTYIDLFAGICVNSICPGLVDTRMMRDNFPEVPEERLMPPEAVARSALFLAGPDGDYYWGEQMRIGGGLLVWDSGRKNMAGTGQRPAGLL